METLENLKREKVKLLSEREVRSDFEARDRERKTIQRDIIGLKHERKIKVVRKIKNVGLRVGRGLGIMGKYAGKGLIKGVTMAGEQYAKAEESRRPTRTKRKVKRVRKVRRVKKR